MTTLELLLALTITAVVAVAALALLHMATVGLSHPRDNREVIVRTATGRARLAAYVTPARMVLDAGGSNAVLWLDDHRPGGTVHGSELRWIRFDGIDGTLGVDYVKYPDTWTQPEIEIADLEHPDGSDWDVVRQTYDAAGHLATLVLLDGLESAAASVDGDGQLTYTLEFTTMNGSVPIAVTATPAHPQGPVS